MTIRIERPYWMKDALCAQVGGDCWHPEKGGQSRTAVAVARGICAGCPVRSDCLDHALTHETANQPGSGIWGGMTWHERKALLRARRDAPLGQVA